MGIAENQFGEVDGLLGHEGLAMMTPRPCGVPILALCADADRLTFRMIGRSSANDSEVRPRLMSRLGAQTRRALALAGAAH